MYRQIRATLLIYSIDMAPRPQRGSRPKPRLRKARKMLGTWRISSELAQPLKGHPGTGQLRRFRKNETLYEQGTQSTKFYFIVSGLVQVSMARADGVEVVLEYMGPDTICGEGAALDGLPRFSRAVAVEETEAIEFDSNRIDKLIARDPAFALALLRATSLKQRVLALKLEHLFSREPKERIMDLFLRVQEMFGSDHPQGKLLTTRMTHEQIGAMTGTSRVTVTRAVRSLREEGKIDIVNGRVLVRNSHSHMTLPAPR